MMTYHILSLKWSKHEDKYVWWGPNSCGYTEDINKAGIYTSEEVQNKKSYFDDGVTTKAIPVRTVNKLDCAKVVPTTTGNARLLGLLSKEVS